MSNDFAKRRKKAEEPQSTAVETPAQQAQAAQEEAASSESSTTWKAAPETLPQPEPAPAPEKKEVKQSMEMPSSDDFAAMLAGEVIERPNFERGQQVTAAIIAKDGDNFFVSLGAKSEGTIDAREFMNDEGELTKAIGDTIEAYIISTRRGEIRLARTMGGKHIDASMLQDAMEASIPVEGTVSETNKGGYVVETLGVRAFCPLSQIDFEGAEPSTHVGQTYRFKVTRVEEGGRNVVVSRTALIKEERARKAVEILATLELDQIVEGTVTRLANFGAFVDIGGVDGLVHVSQLGWSRVDDPAEVVSVGDKVRAKVVKIEPNEDPSRTRIGLSMKDLQEDPWALAMQRLEIGRAYPGKVARLESFGAFVELGPGLDGLVHISEITTGRRINHPREVLTEGDAVEVQVIRLDPQRRQIGLSMKALMADPWSTAAASLPVGTTVQGTVESVKEFGVFIELPGGISGMLPRSQFNEADQKNALSRFKPGDSVEARVLEIDMNRRRLTLTRREDEDGNAQADFKQWQQAQPAAKASGFGTFADLLKKRK